MKNRHKKPLVNAAIKDFSKKGNGLGSFLAGDGKEKPVEVPFTMPGDQALVQLTKRKAGKNVGVIDSLETRSPERQEPRCKHFAVCGGCRWQHVPYDLQAAWKDTFIRRCFKDLLTDQVEVAPILKAEELFGYRNKMEFSFSQDRSGNRYLGLFMDSSNGKVLNLEECHLVNTWFVDALKAVRQWWEASGLEAFDPPKNKGILRTLTLREGKRSGDRMAILTVSAQTEDGLKKTHIEAFVASLAAAIQPAHENGLSIFLRVQQCLAGQPTNFFEMHLYGPEYIRETLFVKPTTEGSSFETHFRISPTAFFQPNIFQAEELYSKALQLAGLNSESVVYDLYCGTGTIGISASKVAKQVIGIELCSESALDARTNAALNKAHNVTILSGAVRYLLGQIFETKRFPSPDIVFIDPPRPGLDPEAMEQLKILMPPVIVYISCNPETQAPDVAQLIQAGYRLISIQPIDQFPQTVHIENIAILKKEVAC